MIEADIKELQNTIRKLQTDVDTIKPVDTATLDALTKRVGILEKELESVKECVKNTPA
jgi:hypothetical protein